ncbi:hypothetical protein AA13595_3013 [Gluconacetobacter johannae DSM 13595]|nr:hypothetical protein AA13595_3013 [Gluconacetobacter johannae DSM 13595]
MVVPEPVPMPTAMPVSMVMPVVMVMAVGVSLVGIVVGMHVGRVVRVGHGVLDVSMSGERAALSNRRPGGAARAVAFRRGRPS